MISVHRDGLEDGRYRLKGKVLVVGSDTRAFLTVVRSLGRAGLTVHVAGCSEASAARHSRYVTLAHKLPPYDIPDLWCTALVALMRREAFDLVLPCDDPSILPIQKYRSVLERYGRIALLDDDVFAVITDKALTYALAVREAVPVPREETVNAASDPEGIAQSLGLPVVLKPRQSFTINELATKRFVRTARDVAILRALLCELKPGEVLSAQEYVRGLGVGVEVLANDGAPLCVFQHERVHEPLEGGGSSYRRSVVPTPELVEAATRLLRVLRYTGVAMVEFKVNSESRRWVLVEINGRFWGSLPLAVAAGADFPRFLYEMLVQGRRSFPSSFRNGLYARNVIADIDWMRANFKADRSDPFLMTRPLGAVAGEVGHLLSGRERWDTFTLDDPRPALAETVVLFRRATYRARQGVRSGLDRIPGIRALHRIRLRSALSRARTILFVCKGNICRSPYAEHYLSRHVRARLAVSSSGYFPTVGRSSPAVAVTVAMEFGISLANHRSRRFDENALRQADVIIVFDAENREQIASTFPQLAARVHQIGVLGHDGPLDVADPYNGDAAAFRACYGRLNVLLDEVASVYYGTNTDLP